MVGWENVHKQNLSHQKKKKKKRKKKYTRYVQKNCCQDIYK